MKIEFEENLREDYIYEVFNIYEYLLHNILDSSNTIY